MNGLQWSRVRLRFTSRYSLFGFIGRPKISKCLPSNLKTTFSTDTSFIHTFLVHASFITASFYLALLALLITLPSEVNANQVPQSRYQDESKIDSDMSFLSEAKTYITTIPNASLSINIDGQVTADEWEGAQEVSLDFITRPFEDLPSPVNTTAKVFEDGTNLFVLFIASDPQPERVRAFLRDRDSSRGEDLVGIKLDTFNDGRLAYNFFMNPLGVQSDSIENEMTGNESNSWNGIWESAGTLSETGYVVEAKIPLRLLNFEESDTAKTWGIEFVRIYPREDFYRISNVPFDRDNACNLCQMGTAVGFDDAEQGRNLAIVPTLVLGKSRTRDPLVTRDWDESSNQEVGIDVNWGISPELTFTGTLNPDFSQVEADDAQLDINNTFALFFDERRPFFVENADYFSSNQNFIYTRNINAPDYGAKITGRLGPHSIGAFVANDETTNFLVPGNLGSSVARLQESSQNFAGRYRFDYSDDLSLGALATMRHSDSYQNMLTSIDMRYRISDIDTVRAQLSRSETEYPELLFQSFCDNNCEENSDFNESVLRTNRLGSFAGQALQIAYNRDTDNYSLLARHNETDADFRADLGFISRIDTKKSVLGGGYVWRSDDDWWNQFRLSGDWDITHNDNDELIEKELEGYATLDAVYQSVARLGVRKRTRVGLRHDPSSLAILDNSTRFNEISHSFYGQLTPNQTFSLSMFARKGDEVDLANNRLGKLTFFEQSINANLGTHLRLEIERQRRRLEVNNMPLFDAHLYDVRATYQFDTRQFLRIVLNYSDIDRNQSNYIFDVNENDRNLGLQVLYSYKVNPLTKFFIGLSQGAFDTDALNSLEADSQSVFMKFSYAWLPAF